METNDFVTSRIYKNPVTAELAVSPNYFNYAYSVYEKGFRTEPEWLIMTNAEAAHFAAAITNAGSKYMSIVKATITSKISEAAPYTLYFRSKETMLAYTKENNNMSDVACIKVQLNLMMQFLHSIDIGNTILVNNETAHTLDLDRIDDLVTGKGQEEGKHRKRVLPDLMSTRAVEYLIYTNDKDVNTYVTLVDIFTVDETLLRDALVIYDDGSEVTYLLLSWFYRNDPIWYYADLFFSDNVGDNGNVIDITENEVKLQATDKIETTPSTTVTNNADDSDIVDAALSMFYEARRDYKLLKATFKLNRDDCKLIKYKHNHDKMMKQVTSVLSLANISAELDEIDLYIMDELYRAGIKLYKYGEIGANYYFKIPKMDKIEKIYDAADYYNWGDMYRVEMLRVLHLIIEFNHCIHP